MTYMILLESGFVETREVDLVALYSTTTHVIDATRVDV